MTNSPTNRRYEPDDTDAMSVRTKVGIAAADQAANTVTSIIRFA